jgi:heterodisulfide reductase subunit C
MESISQRTRSCLYSERWSISWKIKRVRFSELKQDPHCYLCSICVASCETRCIMDFSKSRSYYIFIYIYIYIWKKKDPIIYLCFCLRWEFGVLLENLVVVLHRDVRITYVDDHSTGSSSLLCSSAIGFLPFY